MRLLLRSASCLRTARASQQWVQPFQVVQQPATLRLRTLVSASRLKRVTAMATAQQVTDALQELLPTIDTNTATERKIREQLAEKLGDINEHKKLIKGIIDDFLTEQLTQSQADSDPQPPSSKRQRTARSADAAVAAAETPSAGSTEGAPEGGVMLDTQGLKWASVSTFKGQQYINIRNYFRAKDTGALGPTKKGISLNPGLWSTLQTALPQLQQAVSDGNEDFAVQLSSTVKATISTYGGKLQLDIREYYEDGGELKPGMKGIALLPQQFDSLVEAVPTLNQQLSSKSAPAAAAAAGLGASKPTAAAAPAAGVKARGGSSSSAGNGPVIELGGRKRVTISSFGGGGVDLRETYEKDGQTMPGKKGILLKYAQWEAVCAAAEHITKALEMRNMKYKLDLGNKRTVQLSEFKNQYYVAIREYYEKDGKMLPGQKGLNLKGDEWYKLADGMAQINEHIK